MVQRRAQGDGCWQLGNDEVVQQASPLLDEREEQDQGPFLAAASSFRRRSSPPSIRGYVSTVVHVVTSSFAVFFDALP